ncbi:MAG: hypothetical protein RLZZ557_1628 [Bacteroidota bacterium]
MLSRIADSMFWMNRYLERSEGLLRMLMTSYVLSLDKGLSGSNSWEPVMHIFSGLSPERRLEIASHPNQAIQYLLLDQENNNSLKSILNRARENARGMQDHITKEMWEQVNQLYHLVNSPKTEKGLVSGEQLATMETLLNNCLLYTGITDSTMPRGMAWGFMNLGKYIERCQLTLSITATHFNGISSKGQQDRDILFWRSLLFTLSGYELHLKHYRSADTDRNVLDQVIFNRYFPHAVIYSLERVKKYLQDLVEQNQPDGRTEMMRLFGRLMSQVQYADQQVLQDETLMGFLDATQSNINAFHHQLSHTFFSYS